MQNKTTDFKQASLPLPDHSKLWPLYGEGFDKLGHNGNMLDVILPEYGPNELLVRHDATGICFSDIKVIKAGQNHPRIRKNMQEDPVVLGHEVAMTVVGVGENLRKQYQPGDRFIIQADIYVDGVMWTYGYEVQGGFSQYNVIDQRTLNGDEGNYLIPVKPSMGYAEAALTEPWACIEASYTVVYRTQWLPGGTLLLTGDGLNIELGEALTWRPAKVALAVTDHDFAAEVQSWAADAGVEIIADAPELTFDDIVILSNDSDLIEQAFARLNNGGIFNVVSAEPVARRASLDIGRLHYDNLAVVGTAQRDLSSAYTPIRTQLKNGGRTWILGAGGPMGHMHLQRALQIEDHPAQVVATNRRELRLDAIDTKFANLAQSAGVALASFAHESFADDAALSAHLQQVSQQQGFDDVVINAPSTEPIELAMDHLADGAVMNVFAGLPRGTMAQFDINGIVQRGVRYTGTSGSSIADLCNMRDLAESGTISPNGAVAAIAGLEGTADGLRAVADGQFPGKVVIYPNLSQPLPLTTLAELKEKHPTVFEKLDNGQTWTVEAEEELLRLML